MDSADSVASAAKDIASGVLDIYNNGSTTPGLFPLPYYFWESGLASDSLINYWARTGDDTYNDLVGEGMLWQIGPNSDFMPPNQTKNEGNDGQSSWALAAMTAAENGFPLPPGADQNVSWAQLAKNALDSQIARWDTDSCGGGLRWQIFTFNNGYNYKNSLSNGNFVQLAARLAKYTGNDTYGDWAVNTTQWSLDVGLISNATASIGAIFDGTDSTTNCTQINHIQWTSSAGTYLSGAAYAYNSTPTKFWQSFLTTIALNANRTFAEDGILTEVACAPNDNCNTDQLAFRAILARALANAKDFSLDIPFYNSSATSLNASSRGEPYTTFHTVLNQISQASAKGAAAQCSGGDSGNVCGNDWTASEWDGQAGLGEQLSALEIVLANLPAKAIRNVNSTGIVGSNGTATNGSGSGTATNGSSSPTTSPTSSNDSGRLQPTFILVGGLAALTAVLL